MNYDNLSATIAWMAVCLGDPHTFGEAVKKAQTKVNKTVPRTHKHRLK